MGQTDLFSPGRKENGLFPLQSNWPTTIQNILFSEANDLREIFVKDVIDRHRNRIIDQNLRLIERERDREMKLSTYLIVSLSVVVVLLSAFTDLGLCREDPFIRMKPGGIHDCKGTQNSAEIVSIGQFAVQEHNKKEVFLR